MKQQKYHLIRKQRADLRALLRGLISLYLLYLGGQLAFQSGGDMSPVLRYLIGGLFALGAAAFGVYTFRQYQRDRRAAELTDEERAEALRQEEDPPEQNTR